MAALITVIVYSVLIAYVLGVSTIFLWSKIREGQGIT